MAHHITRHIRLRFAPYLRKPPPILHGCSLSAIIHPCNIVYAETLDEIRLHLILYCTTIMINLFLASVARNTLNKLVESLDCPPAKLTVAFIPTAGNVLKDNWFVTADRDKLIDLGFKVIDVNLEGKTKNQLSKEITGVDIIFVAGGNTFYLLQETRKSGFDEIVTSFVGKGGTYIGSSAGTLLAGPSTELAKDIDNQEEAPELKSYDGLALVDFVVLPHYDDKNFKDKIDKNLQNRQNYKYKVIKISDNQAVVVKENSFKIVSN